MLLVFLLRMVIIYCMSLGMFSSLFSALSSSLSGRSSSSVSALSSALLQVENLSLAVAGRALLSEVSLTVQAGECLAVIGPNGSGKSTLLRALAGALAPCAGGLWFNGRPLAALGRAGRARVMALLSQHEKADLRLSVWQYVSLGRIPFYGQDSAAKAEEIVRAALDEVGLLAFKDRRLAALSGGERQRAALARAFAQTPQLLLLDEPTNHLDPLARSRLLWRAKRKGVAVIAVLHELSLVAPFADRVAVMDKGRLLCCERPSVVLSGELIGQVFGMESFVVSHPRTGEPLHIFEAPQGAL